MHKLNIQTDNMDIKEEDIKKVIEVLNSSQMSIFNSNIINEFEFKFKKFLSKNNDYNVVSMPNCTTAIFTALELLNLDEDSEIIVQNLTHSSTIYPIINSKRCKIRVCDFDSSGYNINLEHLESLINKKTKVIIICYLHGFIFNVEEVKKICDKHKIKLIEDVAQGLGVELDIGMAGTIADYGCFSFGKNKLLRMGEGGALLYKKSNEKNLIDRFRHVGEVWKSSSQSTVSANSTYEDILMNGLDYLGNGFNFRCNTLNIALAIRPLENLNKIIEVRRNKLKIYKKILKDINGVNLINDNIEQSAPISAWFLIDTKKYDINKIILKFIELGVPIGKFKYPTVNEITAFENYILNKEDKMINSSRIKNSSIFLPLYENTTEEDIFEIAKMLRYILMNYEELKESESIRKQEIKYFDGFFVK